MIIANACLMIIFANACLIFIAYVSSACLIIVANALFSWDVGIIT